MSNTCEIISPSRSSNIIRVSGTTPFNDGSNDTIETKPETKGRGRRQNLFEGFVFIGPVISDKKTTVPPIDKSPNLRFDNKLSEVRTESIPKIQKFSDEVQNNVFNKLVKDIKIDTRFNTKSEIAKGVSKSIDRMDTTSYGSSNTTSMLEDLSGVGGNLSGFEAGTFIERQQVFKSPPDLNILDAMYLNNDVSIEYYSSPNKISKNGLIEPLYIRETSTFEFNEKSFKSSLSINDARMRSFVIKEATNYNDKGIEFFEDNIDAFVMQRNSIINNNFVESYNLATNSYIVSATAGKTHRNKLLDTSWISNDNTHITPFEQKYNTIESEISFSDYVKLNNTKILEYYTENNITISNQYPKIYEDKYSTGYTYDRSKIHGLDSIAYGDFLE